MDKGFPKEGGGGGSDVWEKFPNNIVFFLRAYLSLVALVTSTFEIIFTDLEKSKNDDKEDRGNPSQADDDDQLDLGIKLLFHALAYLVGISCSRSPCCVLLALSWKIQVQIS